LQESNDLNNDVYARQKRKDRKPNKLSASRTVFEGSELKIEFISSEQDICKLSFAPEEDACL